MTDKPQRTVYERYAEGAEKAVVGCLWGLLAALLVAVLWVVLVAALFSR